MKQTLVIALLLAFLAPANAQIFNPYRRHLNQAEKKAAEKLKGGADFVIDPIESVPSATRRTLSIEAQTNWGKDYLLPAPLVARIRSECTYKVTVKIADTGMPDHASLKQGQLPGANYTTSTNLNDGQGHSTHVHGIVCGDEIGICDVLVDKNLVTHKAVKVLGDDGSGSFTWIQNAIATERADDKARLDRGEYVVWNGSLGGGTSIVDAVDAEIKKSTDLGVVFCFAAGNTGATGVNYPGGGKYSIACASLDQNLARSSYSTMGPEVWAAMPGRNINSTYKGNTWATLSGTSMATPFLTAATTIAYSKWGPKLRGLDKVRAYLAWCAKDLGAAGKDNEYGYGVDLIQNILDRDPDQTPGLPTNPTPPPPTPNPGDGLKSITPLPVALKGTYKVLWSNLSASATEQKAKTFKVAGAGSRAKNRNLANVETYVTFEISAPSSASASTTSDKLEKAVSDYFTNRGFLLPAGQDESWAAYWAAYFLEMGLQQNGDWRVTVQTVAFKTSNGQTVALTDIKHWPLK